LFLVGFVVLVLVPIVFYLDKPVPYSEGWLFFDQQPCVILVAPIALPAVHRLLAAALRRSRQQCFHAAARPSDV
jgi:hypothetical protein